MGLKSSSSVDSNFEEMIKAINNLLRWYVEVKLYTPEKYIIKRQANLKISKDCRKMLMIQKNVDDCNSQDVRLPSLCDRGRCVRVRKQILESSLLMCCL